MSDNRKNELQEQKYVFVMHETDKIWIFLEGNVSKTWIWEKVSRYPNPDEENWLRLYSLEARSTIWTDFE